VSRALRIGTRGSDLALWQAHRVADLLTAAGADEGEIVVVRTGGDADASRPLWRLADVGFFTKELQAALLADEVDVVVHSLKDLPIDEPDGLAVAAVLQRDDPRELLVARPEAVGPDGLGLRRGAVLGTSSLRRAGQALAAQPDLVVRPLRGNVPTRIRRLREGSFDAIMLAAAGVDRLALDLEGLHVRRCEVAEIVPAPGQGALAVEVRSGDDAVTAAVRPLHDRCVAEAISCERAVLKGLGGGCHLPLGAFAQPHGSGVDLQAALAKLDGSISRATVRRTRVFGDSGLAAAAAALAELDGGMS
jgi:hydroxymethylbilane synthase